MGTRSMAKWGAGDERWIVEERADGANVNNWHWTEKNVTKLAEQTLKDMLREAPDCQEGCRLTDVSRFSGFVNLCNRKGKLKVTYSLEATLRWKREVRESPEDEEPSASASGTIVLDEIFDDEPEAVFNIDKKKTKGSGAEPDKNLQNALCEQAVKHILCLLADLGAGKIGLESPKTNRSDENNAACSNNSNIK